MQNFIFNFRVIIHFIVSTRKPINASKIILLSRLSCHVLGRRDKGSVEPLYVPLCTVACFLWIPKNCIEPTCHMIRL